MKTVKEKLIIRFYNIFIHRWLRWKIFVSEKIHKSGYLQIRDAIDYDEFTYICNIY